MSARPRSPSANSISRNASDRARVWPSATLPTVRRSRRAAALFCSNIPAGCGSPERCDFRLQYRTSNLRSFASCASLGAPARYALRAVSELGRSWRQNATTPQGVSISAQARATAESGEAIDADGREHRYDSPIGAFLHYVLCGAAGNPAAPVKPNDHGCDRTHGYPLQKTGPRLALKVWCGEPCLAQARPSPPPVRVYRGCASAGQLTLLSLVPICHRGAPCVRGGMRQSTKQEETIV
jgi:hypothetical protein